MKGKALSPVPATWNNSGIAPQEFALGELRGATVGFLNNSWVCMDILLDRFEKSLRDKYGVRKFVRKQIPLSAAAEPADLEAIASEADFVIVGLAN